MNNEIRKEVIGFTYKAERGPYEGQTLTVIGQCYLLPENYLIGLESGNHFGTAAPRINEMYDAAKRSTNNE
jgi:hypothetical protein